MKRLTVLIGLCLLILPQAGLAADKKHIATPESRECSECHVGQTEVWFNGAHGLMGVKCIVCHGSTDKNFAASPGLAACRGCHGEQVVQALKNPAKEGKSCFPCHDHHALTVTAAPAKPYHAKGGK